MDKKLFFLGAVMLTAIVLGGCFPKRIMVEVVSGPRCGHVCEIEMQNAALKAANEYLLNHGKR